MSWSYATLVGIVSALVTASILVLRAAVDGGGLFVVCAGVALVTLSLVGVFALVRATVLLERERSMR